MLSGLNFPISADNRTRRAFQSVLGDLRDVRGALAGVADYGRRAGRAMQTTGRTLTAGVTAPIVGMGALVLRSAMNFESAMNNVAAVSGASSTELNALTSIAREMGATTRFSAQEAAEGLGFLAMAGLSVEDQISALPGTLQLAAAAGIELSDAADMATNVLGNFGFGFDQLQRVNDVLAATATSANTNVPQLAQAMMEAGGIATMAGLEFEEVAAAMGLMANAGFRGGRAGTAMRGGIARLLNPVGEAERAVEQMGLSIMTAEGTMRPLVDILTDVAPHAEDAGLMMRLFGQEAGPGMAALLMAGPEALRTYTEELRDAGGAAAAMAEIMNRGLRGALNNLSSAFGELMLQISDAGLLEFVTRMTDRLTGFVRTLTETDPALLRMGTGIAAVVAAIGPLLVGLGFVIIGASAAIPALVGFAVAAAPIMLVAAAIGAVAYAVYQIYQNWGDLTGWWSGVWDRVGSIFDNAWASIGEAIGANDPDTLFGTVWGAVGDTFRLYLVDLPGAFGSIFATIGDLIAGTYTPAQVFGMAWESVSSWFGEMLGGLPDVFSNIWQSVSGSTASWPSDAYGWGLLVGSSIRSGFAAIRETGLGIAEWFRESWAAASEIVTTWATDALTWGRDTIQGLIDGIGQMVGALGEAVASLWPAIRDEIASWPGRLIESGRNLVRGLIAGITGGRSDAEAEASSLMQSVINSAETTAEVQSPSRVFMQIGRFLTAGLSQGIEVGKAEPVEAMRGLAAEVVEAGRESENGLSRFASGFASFLGPILRGTQSIGDAFRQMGSRIADSLMNSGLQSLGGLLFNGLGGGKGGGGGGILSALFAGLFADGAAFRGGSVVPFANGGVVGGPTMFPMSGGRTGLMGEAGAEAIMPLARAADGSLGVRASGGGMPAPAMQQQQVAVEVYVRDDGKLAAIARTEGAAAALPVAVRVVEENNELQAERQKR